MICTNTSFYGFDFTSFLYPYNVKAALKVNDVKRIGGYINYINQYKLDQAVISLPSIDMIRSCPSLRFLRIHPPMDSPNNYDFTPLYDHDRITALSVVTRYGVNDKYLGDIDFSKIKGLESLSFGVTKRTVNYTDIPTLKSLLIGGYKACDINELFSSKILDTLELNSCSIESLDGIENSNKIQCVTIIYNRKLKDISALERVRGSLRALNIEYCAQITDFSVIEKLENLEKLFIRGSTPISNLDFVKRMKNLKTLILDVPIISGDITPCLKLQYASVGGDRRHYNLKNRDLPKGLRVLGNEDIDVYRRLE